MKARRLMIAGDRAGALDALGEPNPAKDGRKARSAAEHARLLDLFVNMTTAPGPCRPRYVRTDQIEAFLFLSKATIAAQIEGRPVPPIPPECTFEPDTDVPMSPDDALRNVAAYLGTGERRAWELLNAVNKVGDRSGQPRIVLPRRPTSAR